MLELFCQEKSKKEVHVQAGHFTSLKNELLQELCGITCIFHTLHVPVSHLHQKSSSHWQGPCIEDWLWRQMFSDRASVRLFVLRISCHLMSLILRLIWWIPCNQNPSWNDMVWHMTNIWPFPDLRESTGVWTNRWEPDCFPIPFGQLISDHFSSPFLLLCQAF